MCSWRPGILSYLHNCHSVNIFSIADTWLLHRVNMADYTNSSCLCVQCIMPSMWRSWRPQSWRRRSLSCSTSHPDRSARSLNRAPQASTFWLAMRLDPVVHSYISPFIWLSGIFIVMYVCLTCHSLLTDDSELPGWGLFCSGYHERYD